jgi:PAS domain S-box-containing protein
VTTTNNGIRVLHVDDEPDFADMVATYLEHEDNRFDVRTATSVDEGLAMLADRDVDCIVSDHEMPGRDGIDFLEAIRESHPDLPFILYTGKGSEEIASDAISTGVTDYLQKTEGTDQYTVLSNRITNAVDSYRSQQALAERNRELRKYERMINSMQEAACIYDADGRFDIVNEALADWYGTTRDALEGEPSTLIAHLREEADDDPYRALLQGKREEIRGELAAEFPGHGYAVLEYRLTPLTVDGAVEGVVGVARDVTERREREEELFRRKRAMDEAPAGITITDPTQPDNPIIYANEQFRTLTGYSEADVLGRNCRFLQGENTDPEPIAAMRDAIENENRVTVKLRNYRNDGTEFWNRVSIAPVRDEDGSVVNYVGFQQDVTERKQLERELREEHDILTGILDTSPIGIAVVGPDGTLSFANEHAEQIYGRPREELDEFSHDDPRWDLVDEHGDPLADGETPFDHVVSQEEPVYDQIVGLHRPSGRRVWLSVNGAPQWNDDGELERAVFAFEDITEQRELETELTEIFGRVSDAFYALDDEFRFTHVNKRAEELLQASADDLLGENLWDQYPEAAEVEEVWDAFHTALDTQEPQSYDLYFDPLDFWVEATVYPSENGVSVYFRDITERKEREQTRETREQALRRAYEVIADRDRSVSEQIDALLEIGRDLIGTDYATFSHIHGDQYEFEAVAVASDIELDAGETTALVELPLCERVVRTEQPLVLDDVAAQAPELVDPVWGIACYLGAPVVVGDAPYGTFCFYDVEPRSDAFSDWERTFVELLSDWVGSELTRHRATEQLQRQNERLDEFASIVSHDLLNPLSVADGRLELAREECESDHLDGVERAHERMRTLIDDLLTLAQEGDTATDPTSVDLTTIAEECWRNVETADATLVVDTDRTVRADGSRLKQLFENLVRNAVEHGGEDVTVTIGELDDGFYVEDDGPGIPEADRAEVFDAGYTTSADGTGFGLRIVEQVAKAHGWEIRLSEGVDGGARFTITGVERITE